MAQKKAVLKKIFRRHLQKKIFNVLSIKIFKFEISNRVFEGEYILRFFLKIQSIILLTTFKTGSVVGSP